MEKQFGEHTIYDELHEECGVFGVYNVDGEDVAGLVYYGLFALQHRGQESCGIAVSENRDIRYYKNMGLVNEVFTEENLEIRSYSSRYRRKRF